MEVEFETPEISAKSGLINCTVFWGKQKYEVEIDLDEPFIVFKAQLFALTQVDPSRQKIVHRGRMLRCDVWPDETLKEGSQLRMVGTNDVVVFPKALEEEKVTSKVVRKPPYGIKNYGNTCFMNAVVQIMRAVPEIREVVVKCDIDDQGSERDMKERVIVRAMSELFKNLDARSDAYEYFMLEFISNVEHLYPEYMGSIEKGGRPQQDANEFFIRIIDILKKHLNIEDNKYGSKRNMISSLFGVDIEKTYKCLEKGGDTPRVQNETELQLTCFISNETRFMVDGIKNKFNDVLTMRSNVLQIETDFLLNTQITRLPIYICVQYMRFFFKEQEKINAKIMKDVKFPLRLDMTEFCSSNLKDRLKTMQGLVREMENKMAMASDETAVQSLFKKCENGIYSLPDQKFAFGDSGSGIYQLIAVLTHEGRTTVSGHYVGWVRYDYKKWAKVDDANVSLVEESDILKLSGGGESHSSYLLIYQSFKIPKLLM